jgi:peptidyl-prolyl cis-trans isomerase D
MKKVVFALIFLLICQTSFAQMSLTAAEKQAMDWLQTKTKAFKASKNDSLFIVNNSEKPYYTVKFSPGDQKEDIDREIFSAKVGEIVGPFRGDSFCYSFKVKKFSEPMIRVKAELIQFIPKSFKDEAELKKYIDKYVALIKKDDKEVYKIALKDEEKLALRRKDLGWIWEHQTDKEYYEQVYAAEKGEPVVIRGPKGIFILNVTSEKEKAPYKVELIPLVKKIE